ncbi:MAG: transposase [bacterium]|nr:transposase [bacterium]
MSDDKFFNNKYKTDSCRYKDWDYCKAGYYFITINTGDGEHFFGEIKNSVINLSDIGMVVDNCWSAIPEHFEHTNIDEYIIMPDHIHGILVLDEISANKVDDSYKSPVEHARALEKNRPRPDCAKSREVSKFMSEISPKAGSLSTIIRSFKSAVTRECGEKGFFYFSWKEGFYDRIIRDEVELYEVRNYIRMNPVRRKE